MSECETTERIFRTPKKEEKTMDLTINDIKDMIDTKISHLMYRDNATYGNSVFDDLLHKRINEEKINILMEVLEFIEKRQHESDSSPPLFMKSNNLTGVK
jgi:hypothetical protein